MRSEESEMEFMKVFLRGITLLPGVIQGTEGLFGAQTGEQKKAAALEIVGAAIHIADAVSTRRAPNRSLSQPPKIVKIT